MVDDKEIIIRCQRGQINLMEILVHRYKDDLYRFCFHLTNNKDEADDLFQETWVRAVKKIMTFELNSKFITWICTIALNYYRDSYRKKKRWLNRIKEYFTNEEKEHDIENLSGTKDIPEVETINNEEKSELKKCVQRLDDIFRIPVMLFYFNDMGYTEISKILNIPEGTVKSRLNAGRKKIKEMFECMNQE